MDIPTRTDAAGAPAAPPTDTEVSGRPESLTEATRYLCAAAHLDLGWRGLPGTRLRRRVSEQIIEKPLRAIGVSPGVDLRPVVVQCDVAERRKLVRDAVLAFLFVALFVLPPLSELAGGPALGIVALAFIVVYTEAWIAAYRTVAARMMRDNFDPERESRVSDGRLRVLLDEIGQAQSGNVTVYSGFTPFVGAGYHVGGWSFALNVHQGKRELDGEREPRPFTVAELYADLADDLRASGVEGLEIENRLYVDGRRAREDERFVSVDESHRPPTSVQPLVLESFVGGSGEAVRHYMAVRVVAWGGELVVSTYVRFRLMRGALFVEASSFLLTPLDKACHAVDGIHRAPGWRETVRLFTKSLAATPWLWLKAPFAVAAALGAPLRRWRIARLTRRQILTEPEFDYGAPSSVRDAEKSSNYRQYFQKLDDEMFGKVVERHMLDSITAFLDRHDVDTSDLKQREQAILNNGVLMTGGNLQAGSIAVGSRAQAMVQRMSGGRQDRPGSAPPGNTR